MAKNDGLAEVRKSQFGWQVIINHFEGEPEVWDKFDTEQEAKEAEVRAAQPVPVAPPVEDVVIAPNSMKPTKPKKTRPLKSSSRSTKKAKKE